MPQLSSGRHVGLIPSGLVDALEEGSRTQQHALILAYRLNVEKPRDLLPYLRIAYFDSSQGEPPDAPLYDSGFSLGDITKGEADWDAQEIEDLEYWIATNPEIEGWLQEQFDEINAAIARCSFWDDDS